MRDQNKKALIVKISAFLFSFFYLTKSDIQ